jgi:hypothetical protein
LPPPPTLLARGVSRPSTLLAPSVGTLVLHYSGEHDRAEQDAQDELRELGEEPREEEAERTDVVKEVVGVPRTRVRTEPRR